MSTSFLSVLLLTASLSTAVPLLGPRAATLDPAAVAEAQQRDNTATRAFSAIEIQVRFFSNTFSAKSPDH